VVRPLIATKLYVPRPRQGLVTRARLHELLRSGEQARLTLVSAPAGFGKTTLLADWAQQATATGRPVAWVSLDPSDNEPGSFWSYVVAALQGAVADLGSGDGGLSGPVTGPADAVLTSLVNELAAARGELWLVLDDYHVIEDREVREGVRFFMDHLPPNVHVLVSTRADPDLPLPRWRVRGEVVEIRAADLRFTAEEATAYLNASAGLDLAAPDVAALEERTEGWIAALQLAALSLRGHDDVSGFIARFAGTDRYVVDYLVEEVLAHQGDHVREFLLQTSVLDRLTGSLCNALTLLDDGDQTLGALDRANLFLVPLDDGRHWYRYHHLFADVLRSRLQSERPDLAPVLHRRASAWFESEDLPDEAVRHALLARDFARAAHLMELLVPSIRKHRREAVLLRWLTELPDATVRRSPVLSVFYGYLLMVSGDLDEVGQRFDDAERALAAGTDPGSVPWADTDELRTLPATIAVHRAALAQARGDVAGTVAQATRALALAGPDDHLARGGAAGFLGLAAWAEGDVARALETFTIAVASLHAAGNLVDELTSTVVLADLSLAAGHPGQARTLYQRAMEVADAHGDPVARAAATLRVGLGELDAEAGDLPSARTHLEVAAPVAEGGPMVESLYRWYVARSRVAVAEGDAKQAVELLDQAEASYRPGFFPDVRPIAALRARAQVLLGDLQGATAWAGAQGIATSDGASYLREFEHLTLVRLVIAQHREDPDEAALDAAMALLARLDEAAAATGRHGSRLEIQMLTALAQDALGRRDDAVRTLGVAWAHTPEPDGWVRLFLDEGPAMVDLLRAAEGDADAGDHASRLLEHWVAGERPGQQPAKPERPDQPERRGDGRWPSASSPDVLSGRELEVLRLLDSDLSGPQIARELFVSPNTLRTHTKHIFTKLDVTSRRAAVRRAREQGLL
jgi:LuxR family maltose regulon positive regulatory protein